MEPTRGPLRTHADLERALAEARQLLNRLDEPSVNDRFNTLLRMISDYRGEPSPERGPTDALDTHLKDFGSRWRPAEASGSDEHWKSMVGGDVNPGRGRGWTRQCPSPPPRQGKASHLPRWKCATFRGKPAPPGGARR